MADRLQPIAKRADLFDTLCSELTSPIISGKDCYSLDNYATHKHPEVLTWLANNPRWTFRFTPTSCSLLNAVEGFFSKLTRQALRRGMFCSVEELIATIERYIASINNDPKPFVWTASAASIMAKLKLNQPNDSEHEEVARYMLVLLRMSLMSSGTPEEGITAKWLFSLDLRTGERVAFPTNCRSQERRIPAACG